MRTGLFKSLLKAVSVKAVIVLGFSGCATAPLETSGSLASYDGLAPVSGVVTQSKLRSNKADVLAATSVTIVPTSFSGTAARVGLTEKQRRVIANAVDRSVGIGLSGDAMPVTN